MVAAPKPLDERALDPAIANSVLDGGVPREPHRQFALKHEDCFVVADEHGDIQGSGDGLFRNDTRVLSRLKLYVNGSQPALLGASLSQDNILFTANLSNRVQTNDNPIPHGVVHIERSRLLWQDRMYEQVAITNYWGRQLVVPVRFEFSADFRDMFEVRGTTRSRRGRAHDADVSKSWVSYLYEGLDSVVRRSTIAFSHTPDSLDMGQAEFSVTVGPRERQYIYLEIGDTPEHPDRARFRSAAARARYAMRSKRRTGATVQSSGRVFNDWLIRARADIALLTTDLDTGPYPYAGIPWFSTAFGRDGVISAIQMLWLDPRLALGVLSFLAEHQSTESSVFSDAEPGKIMHETRKGEMAVLRELPFGR
jgi:glycogen debranching enzyme